MRNETAALASPPSSPGIGCRCENSISFRLSQGVATIFVFGVRARTLPLNVLRGGERTEDGSEGDPRSPV